MVLCCFSVFLCFGNPFGTGLQIKTYFWMFLYGVFLFLDPRRGRFGHHPTGKRRKISTTQKEREKATPPKVGGGAISLPPWCCLDLLLLWIVVLCPLRPLGRCCFPLPPFGWGGLASSSFRLCCLPPPLLDGSQRKKSTGPKGARMKAPLP